MYVPIVLVLVNMKYLTITPFTPLLSPKIKSLSRIFCKKTVCTNSIIPFSCFDMMLLILLTVVMTMALDITDCCYDYGCWYDWLLIWLTVVMTGFWYDWLLLWLAVDMTDCSYDWLLLLLTCYNWLLISLTVVMTMAVDMTDYCYDYGCWYY
jgi:hypothetical protein